MCPGEIQLQRKALPQMLYPILVVAQVGDVISLTMQP